MATDHQAEIEALRKTFQQISSVSNPEGLRERIAELLDTPVLSARGDVVSNVETRNGNQRIVTTLQVDYSFGLGLKGYSWDESNGGKSPDDAKLFTGTNWQMVASDIKQTAGVLTVADADK